jgi:DNA-binding NarL/FixJ family response regulator
MITKILLVDQHKILREGICSLIEKETEMNVVGETDNGADAIQLARRLKPHVVVMDISMPEMNAIDATRQIVAESPRTKVIGFFNIYNKQYLASMIKSGASGYVLKEKPFKELQLAIKTVIKNKTYFPEETPKVACENKQNQPIEEQDDIKLTDREIKVIQLIAEGKNSREIAIEIKKSSKTVDACRREIMKKLNINNMADMVKYAIRRSMTSTPSAEA